MEAGTVVHATTHYNVIRGDTEYEIVNLATGIVEATEKVLPQAILHAENSNSFLVNKLWRWIAVQGAQNGDSLDKDDPVSALHNFNNDGPVN